MSTASSRHKSIISVDVEDYFQVEAFSQSVKRDNWHLYESRVESNTYRLLDLFDETGVKATFFILGWVAERHPGIVSEIVRRGHEPACHSYWHRLIYSLTPAEFRKDTSLAKDRIEQACGQEIVGYRAPSFSITEKCPWAVEILAELGFRYDSSIFPVKHDFYGIPGAPRVPFRIPTRSGMLTEFPMPTFRFANMPNLPVGGGGYLRMLPYWYTNWGIRRAWEEGITVVSYIHPWEIDPEQPRLAASLRSKLRHYTNLGKTKDRLRDLLGAGEFLPFKSSNSVEQMPLWRFRADVASKPALSIDFVEAEDRLSA